MRYQQRKRRYRIRNWPDYNATLVRRGSITRRVEQSAVNKCATRLEDERAAPVENESRPGVFEAAGAS